MLDNEDESNALFRYAGKYMKFDMTNNAGYLNIHWLIIFRKISGILCATEISSTVMEIFNKFVPNSLILNQMKCMNFSDSVNDYTTQCNW
jgi:hypothetical protein